MRGFKVGAKHENIRPGGCQARPQRATGSFACFRVRIRCRCAQGKSQRPTSLLAGPIVILDSFSWCSPGTWIHKCLMIKVVSPKSTLEQT